VVAGALGNGVGLLTLIKQNTLNLFIPTDFSLGCPWAKRASLRQLPIVSSVDHSELKEFALAEPFLPKRFDESI
jgi:hypothetical protein